MTAAVLEAIDLGRRYHSDQPWAVRHATFGIRPGSVVALVGPNGAGKSTLIRSCIAFESPDEGRILVAGYDPQKQRAEAILRTGYVPQAASLYRDLTISDHFVIAQAARPAFDLAYARARVQDAGLVLSRRVGELSGGEQARVALAIALGTRAPLLLLDEPLASLDPLARREFLTSFLRDVRSAGVAALLSSHIVTDIEQVADRLLVLAAGRVIFDEDVATARASFRACNHAHPEADSVVGVFPSATGDLVHLVRGIEGGREATLEEIVLGHLAAAKVEGAGEMEP